jgi:hypothetical protein
VVLPVCVIFGTLTRVARQMSSLTVLAPGAHTWSRRVKRNLPRDRRQISPDPSVAQTSSISDEAAPLNRYRSGPQSPLFQWRLNVCLIGLLLAGMLVSTGAVVVQAIPLGSDIGHRATMRAAGIVKVWNGCGWGWHLAPGHWSQWRGT